ncbi:MAG TPA: C45 family autoproteolytic acyltransferase/hydrolase [Spirochaetota bacterium]|nr:C45 family autoproteolytic acyltransferase/hydrolase [Spirochaetota bacterium]HPC41270.1 C45 family autoproteolytic acyltransferase/hydrolase [Spirochaetota bacterium]HPL15691.1 C45 family autoproteolytic acyltransferase/hydrolase [Spirochaetota bacterium]HQF08118.1 C45 family autoproteolytic acyltransferase/hydrolase [Spirochaetota bacterium]HQH96995.1 C45 family autoproteolytic acyltransferase/hydrolase [Spirochaetota bacterium]
MKPPEKRISSIAAMALFVICCFFAMSALPVEADGQGSVRDQKLVIEKGRKSLGAASLEYREGVPFLTLYGGYYDMGYQYGALMKDEVRSAYGEMKKSIDAFFTLVPPVLRPLARLMYNCKASKKERTIPEHYRQELRGFADAAGIDYDTVIRTIFSSDIVGSLSCTSVVVNSRGTMIHGRNLDFPPTTLGRYPLIIEYRPSGKKAYTLVGIVGYLPALSGLNDSGISVTLNISFLVEENRKAGMPAGYKIREILESAGSMADVDSLMKGYAGDGGWFFTIASAGDKTGAVYDIAGGDIRKSPLAQDFVFVENRFLHEELNFRYKHIEESASDLNENRVCKVSEMGKTVRSVDTMAALLRNTDYYGYRNAHGKFTVNNYETVQSMIFLPGSGDIYFSYAPMYAGYARMISYNRNTGKVAVRSPADPRIDSAEVRELLASADRFYADPVGALKEIRPEEANLLQINFAYLMWNFDHDLYDLGKLVPAIDRFLARYPDDASLIKIKAEALVGAGRYAEALPLLEEGLKSRIAAAGDTMRLHALMARACTKIGQSERASRHAREALDMLSRYRLNDEQKKLKRELERIR